MKEKLRIHVKKSGHDPYVRQDVRQAGERDRSGLATKIAGLCLRRRPRWGTVAAIQSRCNGYVRMHSFRQVARTAGAIVLAASFAAAPVMAAPAAKGPCYSVPEFAAEQGIRLHTELMVVGLTCQYMDVKGEVSLFNQYKQFTLKHQARIRGWEAMLVNYFKRTVKANPTRSFDSFRTRLANETSQRAIALTTPVFCGTHAPLVARAMTASIEEIENGLLPDTDGLRMANAPRCDRPAPTFLMADAAVAAAAVAATPSARSVSSGAAAGAKAKSKPQ